MIIIKEEVSAAAAPLVHDSPSSPETKRARALADVEEEESRRAQEEPVLYLLGLSDNEPVAMELCEAHYSPAFPGSGSCTRAAESSIRPASEAKECSQESSLQLRNPPGSTG